MNVKKKILIKLVYVKQLVETECKKENIPHNTIRDYSYDDEAPHHLEHYTWKNKKTKTNIRHIFI